MVYVGWCNLKSFWWSTQKEYLRSIWKIILGYWGGVKRSVIFCQKSERCRYGTYNGHSIRKWKLKSEGERARCGKSLYVQCYSNGKRSWVLGLQYYSGATKKNIGLTVGHHASGADHSIAGGSLRLNEARSLAMRISDLIKRGAESTDQIKKTLFITCPIH